jgi:hypothetical protein
MQIEPVTPAGWETDLVEPVTKALDQLRLLGLGEGGHGSNLPRLEDLQREIERRHTSGALGGRPPIAARLERFDLRQGVVDFGRRERRWSRASGAGDREDAQAQELG